MRRLRCMGPHGPVDRYDVTARLTVRFSVYSDSEKNLGEVIVDDMVNRIDADFDIDDYYYNMYYPDLFAENMEGDR